MINLIQRLENGTAEQQEGLILEAVTLAYDKNWIAEDVFERVRQWVALGAYESAAFTLVPEGHWLKVQCQPKSVLAWCGPMRKGPATKCPVQGRIEYSSLIIKQFVPAIALCIAALKARAAPSVYGEKP